jgi:hypothetical protein
MMINMIFLKGCFLAESVEKVGCGFHGGKVRG